VQQVKVMGIEEVLDGSAFALATRLRGTTDWNDTPRVPRSRHCVQRKLSAPASSIVHRLLSSEPNPFELRLRIRPNRRPFSHGTQDRSSRFPKSAVCIIATNVAPPKPLIPNQPLLTPLFSSRWSEHAEIGRQSFTRTLLHHLAYPSWGTANH
jgi:hypothetical protein